MSAAAVYAACRVAGQPQTLADIAPVARVERARIENAYGVLNRELNLPAKPPEPAEFVPRLVSELGLPAAVERRARTLLDDRGAGGGSSPSGVAGGAVLVAAADCGERARFAQTDVAEAAGVTTSTLRTHRDALRRD
jgi:transcription initiation factor TFIIB